MSFQNSLPSYMSESWTHVYPIYTFQVAEHLQPLGFSGSTIFTINNNLNNQFMPNYYSLPTNQGIMAKDEEWIDRHDEKISQDIKIKEKQVKQAQLKKQKHQKIQKVGRQTQKVQILTCQCKKSFCLKQYCFCFKNGKGCNEKCVCLSCRNTENGLNQKRNSKKSKQVACNCKRTQCSKKYCQCYAAGKGCGENCKCLQCKN